MDIITDINTITQLPRLLIVVILAFGSHLAALIVRLVFLHAGNLVTRGALTKVRTIVQLCSSSTVFAIYFLATGLVLSELGVSITAYLASASVIALAVGFGSQSIVQDVITGLTVILSDLVEINDMVEISGQTGIVQSIGMRFTVLRNSMGANVYIPNRTLASMIKYPRGYIRCLVDVELVPDESVNAEIETRVKVVTQSVKEQFPAIFLAPIELEGRRTTTSGKQYLRIKFRIWPGRGAVIETTFRQEVLARIRQVHAAYTDGMVAVNYEVEQLPRTRSAP